MVDKEKEKKKGEMTLPEPGTLRPKGEVTPGPDNDDMAFRKMDQEDELLILAELKGRAMDTMVYEFEQDLPSGKKRTITGLSYAGVMETARTMNARGVGLIRISPAAPPVFNENDDHIEVTVYAEDKQNGGGYWGTKRQKKFHKNGAPNEFAREQALSKAQRNGLRGLIPQQFMIEMIKQFREQGFSKKLGSGPASPQSNKPAQPSTPPKDSIINEKQVKLLFVKCKEAGFEKDDVKKLVRAKYPEVESRKDLKTSQLNGLLEVLDLIKQRKMTIRYRTDGAMMLEENKEKPEEQKKPESGDF